MSLASNASSARTAARTAFGLRRLPFYVDLHKLALGFSPSEPEFASYAARIRAVATEYFYVAANAAGGHASNTYGAVQSAIAAMTPEQRAMPWMLNAEYPWLEILQQLDSEGVDPAWQAEHAATLAEESARTGIALTNLASYKALAIRVLQDLSDLARASGCPKHVHYSGSLSFSDSTGLPYAARRATAFPSGKHRVSTDATFYPTMEQRFAALVAGGAIRDQAKAQSHADADAPGIYCMVPNGDRAISSGAMAEWQTSAIRYDANGVAQATDFDPTQTRLWVRDTSRRLMGEHRKAHRECWRLGQLAASEVPKRIEPVVFGPFGYAALDGAPMWFHWAGPDQKDIDRTIEDEILALFTPGDQDAPLCCAPAGVWWWNDVGYYYSHLVESMKASSPLVAQSRWGDEVAFFQRPARTTSSLLSTEPERYGVLGSPPAGFASWGVYHATYFDQHSLGDDWHNSGSAGAWWTVAGGSRLPAPCVLDQTSPLAPWLDWTADIHLPHIRKARKHYLSDRACTFVERAVVALERIWR